MITKFTLINEYGQSYAFESKERGLFSKPTGMGFEMSASYTLLGNTWVQDYLTDKQTSITGTILFASEDPYKSQTTCLKFLRASKKLKLSRTTSIGTYYKDVDLTKYSFSKIDNRVLECSVVLQSRSLWYANATLTYSFSTAEDTVLKYPFKFPASFRSKSKGVIDVSNDGSVEAPFTVSFHGAVTNPSLVLTQDEEEKARIDIIGDAAEGETIELSTVDGDLYCYVKKASGNVSLVANLDIENNNFFKIPIGSSRILLTAESDITNQVIFTMKKLYRAV